MAGASITIDYDNAEVLGILRRLGEHIDDLSPLMAPIGEYMVDAIEARFDAQRAPDGTPWAPLSPAYAARKEKNADRILVLDEILSTTIRYQEDERSVAIGTDRIQGATHQFGRGPIPARPFLGAADDDQAAVLQIIRDFVAEAL